MASVEKNSRDVARVVDEKIGRIQAGYLRDSSLARATLARLRRLDTPGGGSWMVVGEELFSDLPFADYPEREQERALLSVKTALKLYAIHQQSKRKPMAVFSSADEPRRGSFGSACHAITFSAKGSSNGSPADERGAKGVRRRMAVAEAASDFGGLETALRTLVRQMRAAEVPLNYGTLARDLYLLQHDWAREGVFMEWAKDYYALKKPNNEQTEES